MHNRYGYMKTQIRQFKILYGFHGAISQKKNVIQKYKKRQEHKINKE